MASLSLSNPTLFRRAPVGLSTEGTPQPRRAAEPARALRVKAGRKQRLTDRAGGHFAGQRLRSPPPRAADPALQLPKQRPTRAAAGHGTPQGNPTPQDGGPSLVPSPFSPLPSSPAGLAWPGLASLRSAPAAARALSLPRLNAPGPRGLAPARTSVRRGRPRAPGRPLSAAPACQAQPADRRGPAPLLPEAPPSLQSRVAPPPPPTCGR